MSASKIQFTFLRVIAAASTVSQQRGDSMASRMGSEDNFIRHALKRPLLGWGPGPQAVPPVEERVQRKAIWDALWIINFTKYGALGLIAWLLVGAIPGTLFARAFGTVNGAYPGMSAGLALVTVLACYQVDCLFNGMIQPVFTFALGGIVSVALARRNLVQVKQRFRGHEFKFPSNEVVDSDPAFIDHG